MNHISNNLNSLQSKLKRLLDKDDIAETQKHIAETRLVYEKKQRESLTGHFREN